jgi:hypothetical protein
LESTKTNKSKFEEDKLLEAISDTSIPDEIRAAEIKNRYNRLADLNFQIIIDSVESITMGDGVVVTNKEHLAEFLANTNSKLIKSVRSWLEEAAKSAELKPLKFTCDNPDCGKEYEVAMTFDYAHFFE